jgi:hypothetical protein
MSLSGTRAGTRLLYAVKQSVNEIAIESAA